MGEGPFLNIKAPKELLERLDDYRFATRKPSRAEAAREEAQALVQKQVEAVIKR